MTTPERTPTPSTAADATLANVAKYQQRQATTGVARGEKRLFDLVFEPGACVLDLGCGTGRVTRELLRRRHRVWACDLDPAALDVLRSSVGSSGDDLVVQLADARDLPFSDHLFDAVVFAFNGLDMIHPEQDRFRAVAEVSRVLKPKGVFILSSHNPVGTLLSPRGICSLANLRWRMHYLITADFRSRYFTDPGGFFLYQAVPSRVISDFEHNSTLTFDFAINHSGTIRNLSLLTLFSMWPYYVFHKTVTNVDS